jgi:hypothetical protein
MHFLRSPEARCIGSNDLQRHCQGADISPWKHFLDSHEASPYRLQVKASENDGMKKYEIYLPLKYNDGSRIESRKITRIREELVDVFGARTVSSQAAPYQGAWNYRGIDFIEDIIKIEIIARADRKTQKFFKQFKQRLKRLLRQIDVLIVAQDIRTI